MRIAAGLLCILLLIAGCSEKDKIPSGVIGKEEMEKILWDMMLADQYAANYIIKDSARVNVKMETLKLYEEVFRLHKVSRDEFRKSYQFYQDRPDITRVMFDSLLARGNRARMENYTRPPQTAQPVVPPAKAADSALKARTVTGGGAKAGVTKPGRKMPGVTTPAAKPPVTSPNRPSHFPAAGRRPFFSPGSGQPVKAGETLFKPVHKDSVTKSRQ
ncbi:MAG TPA: DUF4296 domain-containing protein [Puia sp.]|nr:DUF4296 domain-containing protein [Puia sp.]